MVIPIPVPSVPAASPVLISGCAVSNMPDWLSVFMIIFLIGSYFMLGFLTFEGRDYENFDKFPRYKRIIIKLTYIFLWPLKLIQLLILFIIK